MRIEAFEGYRVRVGHARSLLLLPLAGDPEFDRFYVAAMAQISLNEEWQRRARVVRGPKRKRRLRR